MLIPPYYAASGGEYTQKRFKYLLKSSIYFTCPLAEPLIPLFSCSKAFLLLNSQLSFKGISV
ncbi:hypothetical protein [Rickettsia endosymbiont of Gonocerus acuteangulatus]|uniref:hypothetical protein n=1 Tax=Rickettsia endosymbiont of Gonocerus acuteangulatus TaxID=3066266 RepID=UPI0031334E28